MPCGRLMSLFQASNRCDRVTYDTVLLDKMSYLSDADDREENGQLVPVNWIAVSICE
jgi:hypothetical protein